jgi:plastocyanin
MKTSACLVCVLALAAAADARAADHLVSQKDKAFSIAEAEIAVGDTVTFRNDDEVSHNVFSSAEGMRFNLGLQKPAAQTTQRFDTPGTYEVRCAIHPKMKLKITVK